MSFLDTGSVDFDAFLDLMCKRKHSDTDEELAEAFQMLDADGDGFISVDELFESLNGLDEAVSRVGIAGISNYIPYVSAKCDY